MATTLQERLNQAKNEKDVEHAYRHEFTRAFPGAIITSPHHTDGVLETDTVHVLLEFKYGHDFTRRAELAKPLLQGLMYLKKFYEQEDRIPTALFVGDHNECFMVETDAVLGYLERDEIDWTVPPSGAWQQLPALYREIVADDQINPYILSTVERKFYFHQVVEKLEAIHEGRAYRVPITIYNISAIYRSWEETVLKEDVEPHAAVGAFIASVLGNAYLHPTRANRLVVGRREVGVHASRHMAFFEWFKSQYRVSEKREFTAIKDRLIEEEARRCSGDFYTPACWAHEAHTMLDRLLGEDWREEYVVWDASCATGNLTRDYAFKELYLSTLYEDDVRTIEEMGYNPNAEVFEFDFLNDALPGDGLFVPPGIPEGLLRALEEGRKFVFLNNPPFGTASAGHGSGANKGGVSNTLVRDMMAEEGQKAASRQLYTQFMWRISKIVRDYGLDGSVMALYSKPLFMSGSSFKKFRAQFYGHWDFSNGFLFRADEFNGTSDSWGVSFTVWERSENPGPADGEGVEVPLEVKNRDEHGQITTDQSKTFCSPKRRASEWVKAPRDMWWGKGKDTPQLGSAIKVKENKTNSAKLPKGAFGCFVNHGNNMMHNQQEVILLSSSYSSTWGMPIFPQNFRRCMALFCARKTITGNWINDKDEYRVPDTDHPDYEQWVNDCIVYSLFESASQQSSLRDVDYKGEKWDIENELFFMSREEMMELADAAGFVEMYNDAEVHGGERYLYRQLQEATLSEDAAEILADARRLVREAISMRETAHQERPDLHLQAWDAGWVQMKKGLLKPYFTDEYDAFWERFKAFEDRMREGVYHYGFLKS